MKSNLFNTIVFMFVCVVFSVIIFTQSVEAYKLKTEEKRLIHQLTVEQAKEKALKDKVESLDNDEFVEQIARERLGFIKSDEIIFIRQK